MQFLLLIYDQEKRWRNLDEAQRNSEHQEYGAFSREFAGSIRGGNALQPTSTAKTVRVRDGNAQVTDGPFAETKEQLAGYYLVEAKDSGDAAAIAAKIPWARSGSIEVRPIRTFS
ncbi:MAG TPA: YciI family protein [Bryobacteraceae bacterium]|nr:YciI family protein [Bryobacteraceae bacterium]